MHRLNVCIGMDWCFVDWISLHQVCTQTSSYSNIQFVFLSHLHKKKCCNFQDEALKLWCNMQFLTSTCIWCCNLKVQFKIIINIEIYKNICIICIINYYTELRRNLLKYHRIIFVNFDDDAQLNSWYTRNFFIFLFHYRYIKLDMLPQQMWR